MIGNDIEQEKRQAMQNQGMGHGSLDSAQKSTRPGDNEIPREINFQQNELEKLVGLLEKLHGRLNPVMSDRSENREQAEPTPEPPATPLGAEIRKGTSTIMAMRGMVMNIHQRLEL